MKKGKLEDRERTGNETFGRRFVSWISDKLHSRRRFGNHGSLKFRPSAVRITVMRSCSCLSISKDTVLYDRHPMNNSGDSTEMTHSLLRSSFNGSQTSRYGGYDRSLLDSDSDNESIDKEMEMTFHNDDGSSTSCVVEPNLCSGDLCQILALKNHVAKDGAWSIIEFWPRLGIERTLEDHEIILDVHRELERREPRSGHHFIFRKDFRKYEFFASPLQFFPTEMVDLGENEDILTESTSLAKAYALQTLLNSSDEVPQVFGHMWVREPHKFVWRKAFFVLRRNKLLFSYKIHSVAKFYRRKSKEMVIKSENSDSGDLDEFADLTKCGVYTTVNAKNHFKAPTEFGLALKLPGPEPLEARMCCLACDSERARLCWLTAMRLARHGRQLRESYRQQRQRHSDNISTSAYRSYSTDVITNTSLSPSESIRWRVPMDFTGRAGRIVEDEPQAPLVGAAEGHNWKRRWPGARSLLGQSAPSTSSSPRSTKVFGIGQATTGLEAGIHMTQPWFHSGMSREEAAHLLTTSGLVDGAFVVRESRSKAGIYVLSYLYRGRVYHAQVTQVQEPSRNAICFSLDSGKTKFYDLLQLVEFYQLNSLSLPTQLTHYVIRPSTKPFATIRSLASSF